jgi:hypothetical protein
VLLGPADPADRREAALGLYALLSEIAGISDSAPTASDGAQTILPSGRAISPRDAARCLCDAPRTRAFALGLCAALVQARKRFRGETLEVLYAGCGPFAALATLVAGRFPPEAVRFTLLDVHQRSLDAATRVFQALGLEVSLGECVLADAAEYVPSRPPHVILVETMQRALEHEPQVAIVMNLAPRLRAGGSLVPERITVDAGLLEPAQEFSLTPEELAAVASGGSPRRVRIILGRLLELTAASARDLRVMPGSGTPDGVPRLVPVRIAVPSGAEPGLELALFTRVDVFGAIGLGDYESGLTYPAAAHVEPGVLRNGVEFSYRLGSRPGFESDWDDLPDPPRPARG